MKRKMKARKTNALRGQKRGKKEVKTGKNRQNKGKWKKKEEN